MRPGGTPARGGSASKRIYRALTVVLPVRCSLLDISSPVTHIAQPVAPAPKLGDTPVDHPGASRAVEFELSRTIEVVRPERTIVRDVDEVLPLVRSGTALLVAGAGAVFLLVGGVGRERIGRSH